jgi:predicted ATPase
VITELRIQRFKSWRDTGPIRMAPLTGFFGPNSTGKTAILHFLLMLKQTVETNDRKRVLHLGDEHTDVDLGTSHDIAHRHELPTTLEYAIGWELPYWIGIRRAEYEYEEACSLNNLRFDAAIAIHPDRIYVENFNYRYYEDFHREDLRRIGMQRTDEYSCYELILDGIEPCRKRMLQTPPGHADEVFFPIKGYGFPQLFINQARDDINLSDIVALYESLFREIHYLGPLRDEPRRIYRWSGETPQSVGKHGELAVPALLSRQTPDFYRGEDTPETIGQIVAGWLRELGLIHSFTVRPIAEHRQEYEVYVQMTAGAPEVLLTEVGSGIAQILPVLVLCYYAKTGSTIILEHPELHLHPLAQTGLADVLIDVIQNRGVQIILESHSEHLLLRLQRRIAEEQLAPNDAALYFCELDEAGDSRLTPLTLNEFGSITNWPPKFFGDEFAELQAMGEAEMRRKMKASA